MVEDVKKVKKEKKKERKEKKEKKEKKDKKDKNKKDKLVLELGLEVGVSSFKEKKCKKEESVILVVESDVLMLIGSGYLMFVIMNICYLVRLWFIV